MVNVRDAPVNKILSENGPEYQLKVMPASEEEAESVTSPEPQTESLTVKGLSGRGKTLKQALVSEVSAGILERILTR